MWGNHEVCSRAALMYDPPLSHNASLVPSGPPRGVQVEVINSTTAKVMWRSPVAKQQHGQIRGYQVTYIRLIRDEPVGQPCIRDLLTAGSKVSVDHRHTQTHKHTHRGRPKLNAAGFVTTGCAS